MKRAPGAVVVTLDSHAGVRGSNPVATKSFFFFFIISFLFFSPTVSKRIFINEMMLSCYLSMLVILNLFSRFATFRM